MKPSGRLARVASLSDSEKDQMFSLMDLYYENMDRSVFDSDLEQKQWAIVLDDPINGDIRGFSTQTLIDVVVDGRPGQALFSGDTIVDRDHWAQNPLAQIWGQFALSLIETHCNVPLYWFLITKGYKTYRFLPVFFHEFYPRHDMPTPDWASRISHALGRDRYVKSYDAEAGVVRSGRFGCRLRADVAEVTGGRLRDAHVRFFVEKNPGHVVGDELCCIAPLTRDNFTAAAYRVIGDTPVELGALS